MALKFSSIALQHPLVTLSLDTSVWRGLGAGRNWGEEVGGKSHKT